MASTVETWEHQLLLRAYEALHTPIARAPLPVMSPTHEDAYRYCGSITRANSRTFHLASWLLPREKRRAVHALYAFCRATDDVVDQAEYPEEARARLERWRARATSLPHAYDPVPLAFLDTQARYRIPHGYVHQLIDGIARDLVQRRYKTFADLADYCYGVASTVGLMVMHIIRFESEAALPYAIRLGVALQLTNILRDVGEDWALGRLYLPLDELERFGVTEEGIASQRVDDAWREFMRFQIARTRRLYQDAEPGIALLGAEGRFSIAAAAGLYQAILDDIEAHDYDVFSRRAHVSGLGKARRLPGIWWGARNPTQVTPARQLL